MFSIGEFSRLCRVSTKTLRHYDNINLLKPAWIDEENNYRYYSIEQMERMLLISKLKTYHFPLEDIQKLINKKEKSELIETLKQKAVTLVNEIETLKQLVAQMNSDIDSFERGKRLIFMKDDMEIKIVHTTQKLVASIRKKIKADEGEKLFYELVELIGRNKWQACGEPISIYHNNKDDDANFLDMEVCVPILSGRGQHCRIFEGGDCIYTKFVGSYDDLTGVYPALFAWKEHENYQLAASPYQKYLKGSYDTENPQEYVTEIFLPVKKKQA